MVLPAQVAPCVQPGNMQLHCGHLANLLKKLSLKAQSIVIPNTSIRRTSETEISQACLLTATQRKTNNIQRPRR